MSLPWWGWVSLGVAGVAWFLFRAAKSWRSDVRRGLLEYLQREVPELEVLSVEERRFLLKDAEGESELFLDNLYRRASDLKADDSGGRLSLFADLVATYREQRNAMKVDPERDRLRLMPRLISEADRVSMNRQTKENSLPTLETGVSGLLAVVVLDSEKSVRYVDAATLAELGLSAEAALQIAKENLRPSLPREVVDRAFADGSLNVIKSFDSFDAARLLVLPALLCEGERLLAFIPDRDTLVLMRPPEAPDFSSL
ncbi:MAG TPA: hypothetical protein VI942_12955, partial [Thermoanaerobaculia bacterium]|nr:hypothetical protein [Thermoanaerobaculia bacterium]